MGVALILAGLAGVLTTVVGMGGGQMLLIGLAVLWDPLTALAVTSPALMIGNAHRLWLFRKHMDARVLPYVAGAFPGALLGGVLAASIPSRWLAIAILVMASIALLQGALGWTLKPPPGALLPGGAVVGAVSATGGGAGLLAAPLLMSAGFTGPRYIAAGASGAIAIHIARLLGYSTSGWVGAETLGAGVVLAGAIMAGNAAGVRIRAVIPEAWNPRLERGALAVCLGLAILQLG